jgi:hypothetical protein
LQNLLAESPVVGQALDSFSVSYRLNFGGGLAGQAAAVMGCWSVGLAMTSIPSLNVTPRTSFGNCVRLCETLIFACTQQLKF